MYEHFWAILINIQLIYWHILRNQRCKPWMICCCEVNNTFKPEQNGRQFADKCQNTVLYNDSNLPNVSSCSPNVNTSTLVKVMA